MDDKKNIRALVVDDEAVVRNFFARFLSLEDIEVKCVNDGLEAIEAFKQEKFDIVFLDVKMPKLNGLETFRELKKLSADVKCVMITGYAVDDLLEEARKEGVVAAIPKPLDLGQIDSLLKEHTNLGTNKKINILVVDDEDVVLSFFKKLLRDNLYDVTVLKSGEEALNLVMKKEFDLAFIDIGLTDISGVDLYLKLREIRPSIHVMLITGDPFKAEGIEHFGCLYKPFEIDKIFWELDRIKCLKGLNKT